MFTDEIFCVFFFKLIFMDKINYVATDILTVKSMLIKHYFSLCQFLIKKLKQSYFANFYRFDVLPLWSKKY